MNFDPISELRDTVLRRELTAEEERRVGEWLAHHPEAATEWRTELALARSVRHLPNVPVATNFTTRVMAEIERELARPDAEPTGWSAWRFWLGHRWVSSSALALVVAASAWAGWESVDARRKAEFNRQVSALRALSGLSPDVLEDFDAIRRLGESSPPVDFKLLAALE